MFCFELVINKLVTYVSGVIYRSAQKGRGGLEAM